MEKEFSVPPVPESDIEKLSQSQLVLLTLFVSFVTSMATGIVTVTLLQEAPTEVTQTLTRVVERTIERVVPETKIREVVTNPEDLVVKAVAGASPSLVRIALVGEEPGTEGASSTRALAHRGGGFFMPFISGTVVVAPYRALTETEGGEYVAVLRNGEELPLALMKAFPENGIAVFGIGAGSAKRPALPVYKTGLSLGKTVVALSAGPDADTIGIGAITGLASATASSTSRLETTIYADSSMFGGPIIDTRGMLVGVQVSERRAIHVDLLKSLISEAQTSIDSKPKNQ